MKLITSNPVAMALIFLASPCAAAANEVSDREIRLRRSISHLGGDLAHNGFPLAHSGLFTLLHDDAVDDMKEIERFLEIRSSMSLAPTARIAPPGKAGSKDGKKSKSNKEAATRVKTKDDKSDKDASKKLRKNDKSKNAKTVKETKGKEGIKKTKEGGEETKTNDKLVVAKKEKRHRTLGVGLSEDEALQSEGKSKDGKSKSDKSKLEKSKSGKKEREQVHKDHNKVSLPLSSSQDTKTEDTKTKDKLVEAKEVKGQRALAVGFSEPSGKSKDGKSKSGKSKLEKSKSGKKEKEQVRKDNNKISLPLSSSEDQRDIPNVKITSAPTSSSKVSKDELNKVERGSKGKAGSRKYTVHRRAQAREPVAWKSDRRELGVGCMISTIELSRSSSNSKVGVRKNDGKSGGSKSGEQSESGKSGGKSGKDGSNVGRHDRGLRRTEMGLYACEMSGSWTCCKEYGDKGDDPVCCKEYYTSKGKEEMVLLPGASSSTINGKGSVTDNGKGSSADNGKGGSTDNGTEDRSHSNDIPAFSNQGGGGDTSAFPPQGTSSNFNNARSVSNDNV